MNRRDFKGSVFVKVGQQTGKSFREHRLADARWPDHRNVMTAGRCDFKCASCQRLTAYICEIWRCCWCHRLSWTAVFKRHRLSFAAQRFDGVAQ
jgi:hypothetical protein